MKKHIKEIIIGVLSIAIVVGCFIYKLEDPINLLLNEGYYQEAYDICTDNEVKNDILEENKFASLIKRHSLRYFNGDIFYISDFDSSKYNIFLERQDKPKYLYKVSKPDGFYCYLFANNGVRVLEVKESDLILANEYLNEFSKNNTNLNLNMRYYQDFLKLIDKMFHTGFSGSDYIYNSEKLQKELFDYVSLLEDLYNVKPVNNLKLVVRIYALKKEGKLDRIKEIKR